MTAQMLLGVVDRDAVAALGDAHAHEQRHHDARVGASLEGGRKVLLRARHVARLRERLAAIDEQLGLLLALHHGEVLLELCARRASPGATADERERDRRGGRRAGQGRRHFFFSGLPSLSDTRRSTLPSHET